MWTSWRRNGRLAVSETLTERTVPHSLAGTRQSRSATALGRRLHSSYAHPYSSYNIITLSQCPIFRLFFLFFLSLIILLLPPLFLLAALVNASLRPHGKLHQFVLLYPFTSNHNTFSITTTAHVVKPQRSNYPDLRIDGARNPARASIPVVQHTSR